MAIPKRFYIVTTLCGNRKHLAQATTLRLALKEIQGGPNPMKPGTKFSYKVYEGGNQVECEVTSTGIGGRVVNFRERGK